MNHTSDDVNIDTQNLDKPAVTAPGVLLYDSNRAARIGMPEAVYCLDKHVDDVVAIATRLAKSAIGPVLFTRMTAEHYDAVTEHTDVALDYDKISETAFLGGTLPKRQGQVGIVAAGTSDRAVALEAQRTLKFLGIDSALHVDVGVAGLWRLLDRLENLRREEALIVVAGMDAALASVVGGLVACPVIAVPTSTGYGAARGGETALGAMLASCAQGVVVTNIDNGFGAACAAARIISRP
jgi:NCAIR mutase (PurE)-related protein